MADNGYHSEEEASPFKLEEDDEENVLLAGLEYDNQLECPDFRKLRFEREQRDKEEMQHYSKYITESLMPSKLSFNKEKEHTKHTAAILLQSHIRGFLDRKKYLNLLIEKFEQDEKRRKQKQSEQVEEGRLLVENRILEVEFENFPMLKRNERRRVISRVIVLQRAWRNYVQNSRLNAQIKECIEDIITEIENR